MTRKKPTKRPEKKVDAAEPKEGVEEAEEKAKAEKTA